MDFTTNAITWDNERRVERAKIISNEIIKKIDIANIDKALEFGCGTGLISFNLCQYLQQIVLVDTSEGMISQLDEKIRKANVQNMITYCLDINKQEVLLREYDLIYMSMVLHHIKDYAQVLSKLIDLLTPNGQLCIIDLNEEDGSFHSEDKDFDGHNGFNQEELSKALLDLGLRDVQSATFYSSKKCIGDKELNYTLFIMIGKK